MRDYIDMSPRRVVEVSDSDYDSYESNGYSDLEMVWDDVVTVSGDHGAAHDVWDYLIGVTPPKHECENARPEEG